MPIDAPAAAKGLLDVYDDLVSGATDLVGAASQIAPAAVRDIVCAAGGLASLLGGPLGPFQGPGSRDRQASDLGGILQAACPVPPPPPQLGPSEGPPPFLGGQCECIPYIVSYTRVRANPPQTLTGTFSRPGPISGPINGGVVPENPDRRSWGFYYGTAACGGRRFELLVGAPLDTSAGAFTLTIDGVTRSDGGADDCGDLPGPVIPSPPPGPIPDQPESPVIPPTVPNPDIPGGGGFIFKPEVGPITIGPDGGVNVPVVVNIGGPSLNIPITIPVNVSLPDFAPTVVIGGDGGVSNPDGPTVPPTPPEPVCCRPEPVEGPEVPGEEDEEVEGDDPPTRSRLIGVVVSATVNGERAAITEIAQGGGESNLWVPRLGSIYFRLRTKDGDGNATISSSIDNPVKTLKQFVPVPPSVEVIGFRGVPEPGVSFSISPVLVKDNPSDPT